MYSLRSTEKPPRRVFAMAMAASAPRLTKWTKSEKVTRARQPLLHKQVSYKNSGMALINARNAARSDTSPLFDASANEMSPSWSCRTGRACGASFSPQASGCLVAEICCTIVEKREQLVSASECLHGLSSSLKVAVIVLRTRFNKLPSC